VKAVPVNSASQEPTSQQWNAHPILLPWSQQDLTSKLVVLSSDEDDDLCRCTQVFGNSKKEIQPMKCIDEGKVISDSEVDSSDSNASSESSGNPSSSDYVHNENDADTETEEELRTKRLSSDRFRRKRRYRRGPAQIAKAAAKSVSTSFTFIV